MLKIVQITSITVTLVAVGLIIFALTGSASDAKTDELLSSPGVAEKLQASYAGKRTSETNQDTPLMRQAKAFALRIDPPPPPAPPQQVQRPAGETSPRPKVEVSAKFTLVGTSYNVGDEANSWALINEVGKGFHWVRLGGVVGHLKIEKIGSGSVLIRDGERTYEMVADRTQKPDLVQSYTGETSSALVPDIWKGVDKPVVIIETPQIQESQIQEQQSPEAKKAEIQANIEWLKQLKDNPESVGMTAEEAKELEGLGDMLKTMEAEQQQLESNTPSNSEPNNVKRNEPNENISPVIADTNTNWKPPVERRPIDANDVRSKRAEMLRSRRRR